VDLNLEIIKMVEKYPVLGRFVTPPRSNFFY